MNASRKADRERVAAMLIAAVEKHGAKIERHDEPANPGYSGAGISLRFTLNGVGAMIDVDNLHGGYEALMSWHNAYDGKGGGETGYFSPSFNASVGELQHPRPHHKASSWGTWELLAARLSAGFRHAKEGTAFIKETTEHDD